MEPTEQHLCTFAEAVRMADCSESTLRRKLKANGRQLGATYNGKQWQIPITTLEALGVLSTVKKTVNDTDPTPREKTAELERELAVYRERTAQQEQLISQLKDQLNDKERAIKLLEAAPAQEHKRGLWSRLTSRG